MISGHELHEGSSFKCSGEKEAMESPEICPVMVCDGGRRRQTTGGGEMMSKEQERGCFMFDEEIVEIKPEGGFQLG